MIVEIMVSQDSTQEEIRKYFLQAEKDFNLTPTEMAELLLGSKKSYGTYKKWITASATWHAPSAAVFQHMKTIYDLYKSNKIKTISYLQERIVKNRMDVP